MLEQLLNKAWHLYVHMQLLYTRWLLTIFILQSLHTFIIQNLYLLLLTTNLEIQSIGA